MSLRRLVYFLIIVALGGLLLLNLGELRSFIGIIQKANWLILALILLARYVYYWSNARYFIAMFRIFGSEVDYRRAFKASVVYNVLNTVLPSGGVSGTSYIAAEFSSDVTPSAATAVQLAYYAFSFLTYFVVLFFGLLFLFVSNQFNKVSFRIVILVVILVVIGSIILTAIALNYRLAKRVVWKIFTPINWILKKLKRQPLTHEQVDHFLEDFYHSAKSILKSRHKLIAPVSYCFLIIVAEIASIYIVFLSLGHVVNPGIVVAGYSLAMISSLAAIVTSGVGVYEAVMTATFVALGQPFSVSFAVVLIYRVIAMWLVIPFGLHFYHQDQLSGK